MMAFAKEVITSSLVSSDAFNISLTIPDGPGALPFFMLRIAATVSSLVINGGGPRTASMGGRSSSDQGNSVFRRYRQ